MENNLPDVRLHAFGTTGLLPELVTERTSWLISFLRLDMQGLYAGKASEEAGKHLGSIADSEMHLQGQNLDTWDDGVWACLCPNQQHRRFFNGKITEPLMYRYRLTKNCLNKWKKNMSMAP